MSHIHLFQAQVRAEHKDVKNKMVDILKKFLPNSLFCPVQFI